MLSFVEKNITKYISSGFSCSNGGDEWSSMYTNGQFNAMFYLSRSPNSNCFNFTLGGTMTNPTGSDLVNCNDKSFNMGLYFTPDCSGSPAATYSGTGCSQGSFFDLLGGINLTSYTNAGCRIPSPPSPPSTTSPPHPPTPYPTLHPSTSTTLPLWAVVTISLSGTLTLVAMTCLFRLVCLNRRRG